MEDLKNRLKNFGFTENDTEEFVEIFNKYAKEDCTKEGPKVITEKDIPLFLKEILKGRVVTLVEN